MRKEEILPQPLPRTMSDATTRRKKMKRRRVAPLPLPLPPPSPPRHSLPSLWSPTCRFAPSHRRRRFRR